MRLRIAAVVGSMLLILGVSCSKNETPVSPSLHHAIKVPSEFATIQDAIDTASSGDTVLVADGVYSGAGFRNISLGDTYVVIRSEHGPASTILDGGDTMSGGGKAFYGTDTQLGIKIVGFTMRNFYASQGAAMDLIDSRIMVDDCIFSNNHGAVAGGAIHCKASTIQFTNCTFVNNTSNYGGAIHLMGLSSVRFDRCVFAGNAAAAITANSEADTPTLSCSNVFGNPGGDWSGHIAGQEAVRGNMSVDAGFCDSTDYHLKAGSPLAPGNNSCGQQIGALGVGCELSE